MCSSNKNVMFNLTIFVRSFLTICVRSHLTGCLKKNFLLPNLALANIAVDGEKSNNTVPSVGDPVHCTDANMRYLDNQFGDRVISRRCLKGREWPPRSPDLSPSTSASGGTSSPRCTAHALQTSTSCRPTSQGRWHRLILRWSGGQCWT